MPSSRPSRLFPFALAGILSLALACGGGGSGSSPAAPAPAQATLASITIIPVSPSLSVGQTVDLQATGHFSDGSTVAGYDAQLSWSSSAGSVASVSSTGLVTALASGNTTITASKGSIQATVPVSVAVATRNLLSVTLSPTSFTLPIGQNGDIAATANWSDGTSSTNYNGSLTWVSSAPGVATVNTVGRVTGVTAGSTTITASASGKSATCSVTVPAAAPSLSSITLSPLTATVAVGATQQMAAVGHYSNGTSANIVPITTLPWVA